MTHLNNLKDATFGIALSGGGVRATAFHAGVFKWLAENNQLQKVRNISSVSGGSLFAGLVFHFSDYHWPNNDQYLEETFPKIESLLTSNCFSTYMAKKLFSPISNLRFAFSRANLAAMTIKELWGINAKLENLPQSPVWSINCTTGEMGVRSRFKNSTFGDYKIGYANAKDYPLANAMATSAAFPFGIGPFSLDASKLIWKKRKEWDITKPSVPTDPPASKLHLYDGGVYDNLGLEPLFDSGKQQLKKQESHAFNTIIVSDAGARSNFKKFPRGLSPKRASVIMGIMSDQVVNLRIRSLINYLAQDPTNGYYLQIGSTPQKIIQAVANTNGGLISTKKQWLPNNQIKYASTYKTTLTQLSPEAFQLIAQHGYETLEANHLAHSLREEEKMAV